MMNQNKVTHDQAREIVSALLNVPAVLGVEIVGSVARDRTGNDLDLVVIVDVFRYASFVRFVCQWYGEASETDDYYGGFKSTRRDVALELLKLPPLVNAWFQCATRDISVDFHLMPQGWKEHIAEVQGHLPHDDPDFVSNIAKDAVTVASFDHEGVKRARW